MPIDPPLLIGAGGHARVVLDAWLALQPGLRVQIRDDASTVNELLGQPVVHPALPEMLAGQVAHVAIGNNQVRRQIASAVLAGGGKLQTLVHPHATVSPHARLAAGSLIAAQAVIAPGAIIGEGVIVNHAAVVDHDCTIGNWCHIAPRVVLGGGVRVGDEVLIGSGAVILPGLQVGDGATIGAGAVVTRDVPEGQSWVGIPARNRHG